MRQPSPEMIGHLILVLFIGASLLLACAIEIVLPVQP